MQRIAFVIVSLSVSFAGLSPAEAVDPNGRRAPAARRHVAARQASIELPRLQRGPDGRILGQEWEREMRRRAAQQKATGRVQPRTVVRNVARDAGRFPKNAVRRGAGEWSKVDPRSNANRSVTRNAGRHPKNAFKRGAGKWPQTSPARHAVKGTVRHGAIKAKPGRIAKAGSRAGGKMLKAAGGIGTAVGVGAAAGGLIGNWQQLDADLRAGRITQAQYNRAQATGFVDTAGQLVAIKKMTPTGVVGNAFVGTDPISLGVDVVGDIINGTNNTEKAIGNVGRTLEGHARGVEKLVTNPEAWAKEAERNINKEVNNVGKGIEQAGKDVDKFFKGVFGK